MKNELRLALCGRVAPHRGVLVYLALLGVVGCFASIQAAPQTASSAPQQRFTVLRGIHVLGPSVEMTTAEANCAVIGSSDSAGVKCNPVGVTQKNAYTYNVTLVAQPDGTAYVIACRIGLISNTWCKTLAEGRVLRGTMAKGHFTVLEGDKARVYLVLQTAQIGPLDTDSPVVATPATNAHAAPAREQSAAPAKVSARPVVAASTDLPAECISANAALNANAACVSFNSDPQGADIYVDGKFVGNTPSEMPLVAGPHEIRIEAAQRKPWTRTLEATAAGKITIRANLEAPAK